MRASSRQPVGHDMADENKDQDEYDYDSAGSKMNSRGLECRVRGDSFEDGGLGWWC